MKGYMSVLLVFVLMSFVYERATAQSINAYKAEELMKRLNDGRDTFYIVNFWATWCGPCIKELPEFEELADRYKGKPVKVLLVSLDFKEDYPDKIEKFIKKKKLPHEVAWLNETNANEFIPKISNAWQGSIPATLLYFKKRNYKNLFEGIVKSTQLSILIDKQLISRY